MPAPRLTGKHFLLEWNLNSFQAIVETPPKMRASRSSALTPISGSCELRAVGTSNTGENANHTGREWCEAQGLTAAINAGMLKTEGNTHVGFMRFREHTNNGNANNYQSVAAFDPRDPNSAPFHIFDLDAPQVTMQSILKDYGSAVQNLRLQAPRFQSVEQARQNVE